MLTHFAPMRFYKQTTLRTEAFTHSSFYAQVCEQRNFCTQTPLHTEAFTQEVAYRCFAQRCLCLHESRGTVVFTHRTFSTGTFLHTTVFTQSFISTGTLLTQKNLYTQTAQRRFYTPFFCMQKIYPEHFFTQQQLFGTEAFAHRNFYAQQFLQTNGFTHRNYSRQKSYVLRTARFTHRRFYAQMPLHRKNTQKLVHMARFYTQPAFTQRGFASLLDHLPFVFPTLK